MKHLPPVIYRGSVKNVRGEVSLENFLFEFSDRYSVFDWGEMPDCLEGKGTSLAVMGKVFFKLLENSKNWLNLFNEDLSVFDEEYLSKLKKSKLYLKFCEKGLLHHAELNDEVIPFCSPFLKVKKINVLRPPLVNQNQYNYQAYLEKPIQTLVPLEIIFRLGLPIGNSFSKRIKNNSKTINDLELENIPAEGTFLNCPIIDFSTKLERSDRYLSYSEAQEISGCSNNEWSELKTFANLVGVMLYSFHKKMGLELWDGKIEVAFNQMENGERDFMLVDSIGIDELRLLYKNKSFSKEFLRENYKNSNWYKCLEKAKLKSLETGADFKKICIEEFQSSPEPLAKETYSRALHVYKVYSNVLCKNLNIPLPFESELDLDFYDKRYL